MTCARRRRHRRVHTPLCRSFCESSRYNGNDNNNKQKERESIYKERKSVTDGREWYARRAKKVKKTEEEAIISPFSDLKGPSTRQLGFYALLSSPNCLHKCRCCDTRLSSFDRSPHGRAPRTRMMFSNRVRGTCCSSSCSAHKRVPIHTGQKLYIAEPRAIRAARNWTQKEELERTSARKKERERKRELSTPAPWQLYIRSVPKRRRKKQREGVQQVAQLPGRRGLRPDTADRRGQRHVLPESGVSRSRGNHRIPIAVQSTRTEEHRPTVPESQGDKGPSIVHELRSRRVRDDEHAGDRPALAHRHHARLGALREEPDALLRRHRRLGQHRQSRQRRERHCASIYIMYEVDVSRREMHAITRRRRAPARTAPLPYCYAITTSKIVRDSFVSFLILRSFVYADEHADERVSGLRQGLPAPTHQSRGEALLEQADLPEGLSQSLRRSRLLAQRRVLSSVLRRRLLGPPRLGLPALSRGRRQSDPVHRQLPAWHLRVLQSSLRHAAGVPHDAPAARDQRQAVPVQAVRQSVPTGVPARLRGDQRERHVLVQALQRALLQGVPGHRRRQHLHGAEAARLLLHQRQPGDSDTRRPEHRARARGEFGQYTGDHGLPQDLSQLSSDLAQLPEEPHGDQGRQARDEGVLAGGARQSESAGAVELHVEAAAEDRLAQGTGQDILPLQSKALFTGAYIRLMFFGERYNNISFLLYVILQNIEELRERTGLGSFSEIEVSSTSNGDKVACNITELKSVVYSVTSKAALIKWESFKHHDMRTLLSYVVYSKEAPNQNVSMYDSRDACGGDGWKVTDVAPQDEEKKNPLETAVDDGGGFPYDVPHSNPINYHQSTILASLKPYTQYAYYVKTYTILTERSGAQSKLQYFTTLPGQPSAVRSLAIYSNASDTLVINWLPPLNPNCNLTHYRIIGKLEPYDLNYLKQRNYCDEREYSLCI
ncbi:unnamed protein product [Trichogramma brassicae]|uniref:Fibronectin type-III domain-containing protein n=1 Tax=Trichogramma brassicae TaxID=86971 RepID=A0A6H5INT0_9HYME|nr:unnamed protein product [Trichogramma brassicae]